MNAFEQVRSWWLSKTGQVDLAPAPAAPAPIRPTPSAAVSSTAPSLGRRTITCPQCGSTSVLKQDYDETLDPWFCPVCPYEKRVELMAADDALIRSLRKR